MESVGGVARLDIDVDQWKKRLAALSLEFAQYPDVYESTLSLSAEENTRYITNSEGTKIREPSTLLRVVVYATSRTDDGMDLYRFEGFDAHHAGPATRRHNNPGGDHTDGHRPGRPAGPPRLSNPTPAPPY